VLDAVRELLAETVRAVAAGGAHDLDADLESAAVERVTRRARHQLGGEGGRLSTTRSAGWLQWHEERALVALGAPHRDDCRGRISDRTWR
jgi:hypothetical protein